MKEIDFEGVKANELPGMIVALCSYEDIFGPYHPLTLRLVAELGLALWTYREPGARCLLERAVRDLGRFLNLNDASRLRAMLALRDLWLQERDYLKAGAVQKELLECKGQGLGARHPDTLATQADLAAILLNAGHSTEQEA